LIESGTTDAKIAHGSGCIDLAGVEFVEDSKDECGREAVVELFLCTPGNIAFLCACSNDGNWGRCPQTPGVYRMRQMGFTLRIRDAATRNQRCRSIKVGTLFASHAAPVALRQSRILRTMQELAILAAQTKGKHCSNKEIQF